MLSTEPGAGHLGNLAVNRLSDRINAETPMDSTSTFSSDDATIREIAEKWLAQFKDPTDQVSVEMVTRARPAVIRALRTFDELDRKLDSTHSRSDLRTIRFALNKNAANLRTILADYIRLSLLHIAEHKAERKAARCRRRASAIQSRQTMLELNQLRDEAGNPPHWPISPTELDRRDPLYRVDQSLIHMDRRAVYKVLYAAIWQYLGWTARHLWGLFVTYSVEILIVGVVLGLGISGMFDLIDKRFSGAALLLAFGWGVFDHLWLADRRDAFFLRRRKSWLKASLSSFANSAIRTHVFLALLANKFARKERPLASA
jgi:hypothetical protein